MRSNFFRVHDLISDIFNTAHEFAHTVRSNINLYILMDGCHVLYAMYVDDDGDDADDTV